MKNWILTHKLLTVILACVIGVGAACAVAIPIALRHKHEFSAEWTTDENYHWHKCKDEKCNEVSDKAAHVFDKETVSATYLASEATYTEAAKYYKSCVCGVKGAETFDHGSSLSAKENVVELKEGVTLGKVYDGEAYALAAEEIARNGNGEVTIMYQRKGGVDFGNTAPKNVGEYTVKVSVAATAEWKEAEKTFDFAITAKPLSATATKEYDGTNTISDVIPEGVCEGEEVKVIIFMSNKNAGSGVTSLMLEGKDKDNYQIDQTNVTASITAKPLSATATKEYDGNAIMPATLTGVIDGETVTVAVTMESKNVGATVKEVTLDGKDKDNYTIETDDVDASITPMPISVDWWKEYDNSNIFTGDPTELLEGDEVTITVTMSSADAGATVQNVALTGKDAGNYSLAEEDVTAEISKADISGFEISNAAVFEKGFYVGATNIPDPETNYVEIGDGYGEKTIVWEKELENGVWSRNLTKEEVMQSKTGTFQVRIKYAEGDNYNFGATPSVKFTLNAKPRRLTVKSFAGKTYDGKQLMNFTFNNLVNKFGANSIDGVENITSAMDSGEKYVEYRKKGETLWTKATGTYIPKNAAEYEYRIGVTATEEWEAVVTEVKTFTIKPYEFVLELGYGQNQNNESLDGGKTFILRQYENLIEGQKIQLWLDNEKAGLETEGRSSVFHFIPDRKKIVTADCFFLKIGNITNPVMENYKIVTKSPSVTTVEMTVVNYTTEKSTSGSIIMVEPTEKWIRTTVVKGYFKVGQTVEVYNKKGEKVGEATITEIRAGGTTSASGFAIPSDGQVIIVLDNVAFDNLAELVGGNSKIVVK